MCITFSNPLLKEKQKSNVSLVSMAVMTHFASVMQQVNKQWLFMIKISLRFAYDLKKQRIVISLALTKILFKGLSVMTGYQHFFKSENLF